MAILLYTFRIHTFSHLPFLPTPKRHKPTITPIPIVRLLSQVQSSAHNLSSAAGVANACLLLSCAMMRRTATTAVTRSPVRLSPAPLPPSSATTLSASHNSGPATVTPTALMAQMSGPATVLRRDVTLPLLISAHPWSSTVAVESASTVAGSVMEALTVLTNQMKLIVVRTVANFFFALLVFFAATCFNLLYSFKL